MLSICTTVKNRSRVFVDGHELRLFPQCVASLVNSKPHELPIELVVTDWGSDDWPLAEWLDELAGGLLITHLELKGRFSRGSGRNQAAAAARGDYLFFLDADCLVSERVLRRAYEVLREGNAYFPVLFSYYDPEHSDGWWRHQGFGNCAISRECFETIGGFPEHGYWGKEDVQFYELVCDISEVVREEVEGFFHQWHPDDFKWKNRYGVPSPYQDAKEREESNTQAAIREITEVIAAGDSFILVDENQLAHGLHRVLRLHPFLERNGEHWGPPADSAHAIREVERMRKAGAAWIAFAWPAFWWLDFYSAFHEYLRCQYSVSIDNQRLVVFDLNAHADKQCADLSETQLR